MITGKFTIRGRLIVAGSLALAIVLMLAATGAYSYRLMRRSAATVAIAAEASVKVQLILRALDEILLTQGTIPARALARTSILDFEQSFPKLVAITDDDQLRAEVETSIAPRWVEFARKADAFSRLHAPSTDDEAAMIAFGKLIHEANGLSADIERWYEGIGARAALTLRRLTLTATVASVLMVLALVTLFLWTYRGIVTPISGLVRVMNRVAEGRDYAARAPDQSHDEIGELAEGFNAMLEQVEQRDRHLEAQAGDLRKARDLAEAGSRAKSAFLATMSHEIRTPMNGIIGMTELLRAGALSPQQRRFADAVHQSGEHLLAIINDILDFSKIEAGKLSIENIHFNLRQLVEDLGCLFAGPADAKGIEMLCAIPHNLPATVRGDPVRVRQILTNLLSNAVKFTSRGEVILRVKVVDEDPHRARFRFEIQDTGIGISEEAQRQLFKPFVQADSSTTRRFGGTGLGLAIAKNLVEAMGGQIGVRGEAGGGTLFWVEIPLIKQDAAARSPIDVARHLNGLRVLVVNDNPSNREILAHQLAGWSMRCTAVADGQAALSELQGSETAPPFDLAIIDLYMPGMDGFELARAIRCRAHGAALPLIMLSSVSVASDHPDRRNAPINCYLSKPARQSDLFDAMTTVLSQRALKPVMAPPTPALPVSGAVPTMAHARILVAEDNPVNQQVAGAMLDSLGVAWSLAANGKVALERVLLETFDLVLMDCQMPVMDGFEATAQIRARQREGALPQAVPIVALTANAVEGDRERCLTAGMDDYLSKPFTRERLAATLQRWLPPLQCIPAIPPADSPVRSDQSATRAAADRETDPTAGNGPINPRALNAIRHLPGPNGARLVRKIVDAYLADTPLRVTQLLAAVDAGDAEALRKAAHTLKSSSANVGAEHLAALCRELEVLGREGSVEATEAQLADVESQLPLVFEALLSMVNRGPEGADA